MTHEVKEHAAMSSRWTWFDSAAVIIDACLAEKKFTQERGAAGSINPGQSRHQAAVLPNDFFGLAQDFARVVDWFGRALLVDPFPLGLGVD
jgi:hypothetical protein